MEAIRVNLDLTHFAVEHLRPVTIIKLKGAVSEYMKIQDVQRTPTETIIYFPYSVTHSDGKKQIYYLKRDEFDIFNDLLQINKDEIKKLMIPAQEMATSRTKSHIRYNVSQLTFWEKIKFLFSVNFRNEIIDGFHNN